MRPRTRDDGGRTGGRAAAELRRATRRPLRALDRDAQPRGPLRRHDRTRPQARRRARDDLLDEAEATAIELREGIDDARERIEKAERRRRSGTAVGGLAPGVSIETLEAIAACESGGDPTAVNAAGYYGKYQFDTGTWASVGGSGNPAEASEAEQDYRASLLYSRAGSSPWPVCGQ